MDHQSRSLLNSEMDSVHFDAAHLLRSCPSPPGNIEMPSQQEAEDSIGTMPSLLCGLQEVGEMCEVGLMDLVTPSVEPRCRQ